MSGITGTNSGRQSGSIGTASAGAATDLSNLSGDGENKVAQVWVSYKQTSTAGIIDDYNVSTVADDSAGVFTVNFTSALDNATYSAFAKDTGSTKIQHQHTDTKAADSIIGRTYNEATTPTDMADINIVIFGD